jgi:hypothetical protein
MRLHSKARKHAISLDVKLFYSTMTMPHFILKQYLHGTTVCKNGHVVQHFNKEEERVCAIELTLVQVVTPILLIDTKEPTRQDRLHSIFL